MVIGMYIGPKAYYFRFLIIKNIIIIDAKIYTNQFSVSTTENPLSYLIHHRVRGINNYQPVKSGTFQRI